jgi:hypothetical protein
MFWRRRKLPAEDEPLVPHGLILQAMEEPGSELPPDMLDNSPKDVQPAEPVEMRLRVSTPPESRVQRPESLPEPDKIAPPAKWPRVDEAEMARRAKGMDTAVSFPYRRPILSSAIPDTDEFETEPEIVEPAKLELVPPPVAPPVATPEVPRLASLLSRLRQTRFPSIAPLRLKTNAMFSRVKTGASSGFQSTSKRVQEIRAKSSVTFDAAKLRFAERTQTVFVRSRSGLQHVREGICSADLSPVARAWDRVSSWRVTVRIPAANKRLLASMRDRAQSSVFLVRRMAQRDSRLWSSLGMAGLSALLALAFISAVRHYGPERVEAQPTQSAAAPMNVVRADSKAVAKQSLAAAPATPKPLPVASAGELVGAKPSAIVTEKKPAISSPKKPRVRRNTDEDDYVAKDTYVFYGNAGKPRR